jgi:hypothetical protein
VAAVTGPPGRRQERGLKPPKGDAYFDYGHADWIADRCEPMPRFRSRSSELFASWRDYAEKAGWPASDNKRFRGERERLGFPLRRQKNGNYYVGLRIRQDDPPQDESYG